MSLLTPSHLDQLLSHGSAGLAGVDAHGRLTLVSASLRRLLDSEHEPRTEAELVELLHLRDEHGEEVVSGTEMPLARTLRGEPLRDVVLASCRPGAEVVHLRCSSVPLLDEGGVAVAAVMLLRDVTAERRASRQQDELRRRLLATINHELRTPLMSLAGNVELLEDEAQGAGGDMRALEAVSRATARLQELVETITELADLEAGTHVSRGRCDVGAVVRQVVRDHEPSATVRGLHLRADVHLDRLAEVDAAQLHRALRGLVANALVFAPDGSEVLLHVCGDATWTQVSVADHGPGIPGPERERVVEPFERGDDPRLPVDARGVGLALAKAVVTAHGGRLLLDDNEPHGLVATLLLPTAGSLAIGTSPPPPHVPGQPCPNGGDAL